MKSPKQIALCSPRRIPFAQIGKSLSNYSAHHLGKIVADDIIEKTKLPLNKIDGVIVGEGFANAPNSARVIANLIGLPNEIPCLTVANNCVSGMEAVVESARRILLGEGELFLAIGEESQTSMPFVVKNARINKKTASLDKLKKALSESNLPEGVEVRDTLEDGLGDGETSYGMQVTAEIVSQNYALSRAINDKVAFESFKRALEATEAGLYDPYIIPVKDDEGNMMKADEAVLLRKGLVENPDRMGRAMLLFDNPQMKFTEFQTKYAKDLKKTHAPTVSIFNASPRSDGAAGVIVTTVEKAKELGLQIDAVLTGWKMKGVHPNEMGLGQAAATLGLLQDMNVKIQDVDRVEIHEAFAATAVGALEEIKNQTGWDWEKSFDEKKINTYGGSISIGHPFGATGIRLVANAVMDIKNDSSVNKVLITACAHGGIAGALMIERYKG
ncbi:MAG TPA: thiolase family protein [Leptospiraceae bacterium]|nr:thiolase family protein [Leptospiraceae bacterium]HMW06325.1 thiolase family protein [Leptospiraceae bacterium]HMX30996.1 thiolase family protein [Leptospiraceae bacterium]HMY32185.1 thiolase family protein [Leptospiraceae bacterium]HMZ63814.1 thiolase family protein [Leptospiraceae bacterium]